MTDIRNEPNAQCASSLSPYHNRDAMTSFCPQLSAYAAGCECLKPCRVPALSHRTLPALSARHVARLILVAAYYSAPALRCRAQRDHPGLIAELSDAGVERA